MCKLNIVIHNLYSFILGVIILAEHGWRYLDVWYKVLQWDMNKTMMFALQTFKPIYMYMLFFSVQWRSLSLPRRTCKPS